MGLGDNVPRIVFGIEGSRVKRRAIIMMTVGALLTGVLLSLLMKSFALGQTQVPSQATRVALELEEETLSKENATMENELLKLQSDEDRVERAEKALSEARIKAGMTELTGPGIIITLGDSEQIPLDSDNRNIYIIHEDYLREVVNALWNGGAEAIAINGQRLSTHTGIVCSGSVILINGIPQATPYTIEAIGNPKALQASLDFYYWLVLLSFQDQFGITCDVKEAETPLWIPPAKTISYRYAEPIAEG